MYIFVIEYRFLGNRRRGIHYLIAVFINHCCICFVIQAKVVSRLFCCILNRCQNFLFQLSKKLLFVIVFEVSINWSTLPFCSYIFPSSSNNSISYSSFFLACIWIENMFIISSPPSFSTPLYPLLSRLLNPQCDNYDSKLFPAYYQ